MTQKETGHCYALDVGYETLGDRRQLRGLGITNFYGRGITTTTCETIVKQIGNAWSGGGASTGLSFASNVVDIVAAAEGWKGGQE